MFKLSQISDNAILAILDKHRFDSHLKLSCLLVTLQKNFNTVIHLSCSLPTSLSRLNYSSGCLPMPSAASMRTWYRFRFSCHLDSVDIVVLLQKPSPLRALYRCSEVDVLTYLLMCCHQLLKGQPHNVSIMHIFMDAIL